MAVTINSVRDRIVGALKAAYPEIDVYDEEVRAGLSEPCFYVKLLTAGQTHRLSARAWRTHSFDIHCFAGTNEALHGYADALYNVLRLVGEPGDTIRGTNMHHETVDRVLHFFVDFKLSLVEEAELEPTMQSLTQEVNLK